MGEGEGGKGTGRGEGYWVRETGRGAGGEGWRPWPVGFTVQGLEMLNVVVSHPGCGG